MSIFSFYGNEIITIGEGDMITHSDARYASVERSLRDDHAFHPECHSWYEYIGLNYRMTNPLAAIGLAQTERTAEMVAARQGPRSS